MLSAPLVQEKGVSAAVAMDHGSMDALVSVDIHKRMNCDSIKLTIKFNFPKQFALEAVVATN